MRIAELMTRPVYTIAANLPAEAARDEMQRHGVHHLVVLRDDHIVGVISDHDLGDDRGEAEAVGGTVDDLSTGRVVLASPEMPVKRAAALLRAHRIGCLPVVDGKRLVGIVTTWDLLGYLAGERRA